MKLGKGQRVSIVVLGLLGGYALLGAVRRFWLGGRPFGPEALDIERTREPGAVGLAVLGVALVAVLVRRGLRRHGRGRFAIPALAALVVLTLIDTPVTGLFAAFVTASLLLPAPAGHPSPEPAVRR